MITSLTIGTLPVSFNFTNADIIKIDESKKQIILADSVSRVYKDTIDDGDAETTDVSFENSFPSLRTVTLPYVYDNAGVETPKVVTLADGSTESLLGYIKNNIVAFSINVATSADSVSESKIVLDSVTNGDITVA